MKKFHDIFLIVGLCFITQGITASENQKKVFFDRASINRFKNVAQGYGMALGGANVGIFYRVFIKPKPKLLNESGYEHHTWYDPGKPQFKNIVNGNRFFLGRTLPIFLVGACLYEGYSRGF